MKHQASSNFLLALHALQDFASRTHDTCIYQNHLDINIFFDAVSYQTTLLFSPPTRLLDVDAASWLCLHETQ
jgi:hypothetical protein